MRTQTVLGAAIVLLSFTETTASAQGVSPLPAITAISPASTVVRAPGVLLTVDGASFVAGATVQVDGAAIATTFVSSERLTAALPAFFAASVRSIAVSNPAPGGGVSNALTFTIQNPAPILDSVSPAVVQVGSPATSLDLVGSGFVASSAVTLQGLPLAVTFIGGNRLRVTAPAPQLATAAALSVVVTNPGPGGGDSASRLLTVAGGGGGTGALNPVPVATQLSPASVVAGSPTVVLTVTGGGYVAGSRILFDGAPLPTLFVSAAELRAFVDRTLLVTAGVASVSVESPVPGGGVSTALPFPITAAAGSPVLTAIAPASATAGAASGTLTLAGASFTTGSRVLAGSTELVTTFISSAQLTAALPSSLIALAGTFAVTVTTPGLGSSGPLTFTVNNPVPSLTLASPLVLPAGADATVTLGGGGFVVTSEVRFGGAPVPSTFSSRGRLVAVVPAAALGAGGPGVFTVFNPAPGGGTSGPLQVTVQSACPGGCDDGNPCTIDTCVAAGCSSSPAPDGPFVGTEVTSCGVGACRASGATECLAGAVADSCVPGIPAGVDATCNGEDDDCDGAVDDDFAEVPTTCGVGACARAGRVSCSGGQVVDDCAAGQPAVDDSTCDGADDDCDGRLDEDYLPAVTACGAGACAASGTRSCVAGVEVDSCTPGGAAASDTVCNAVDDDCDGEIDEDYSPRASTCGTGACARTGSVGCSNGAEVDTCTPAAAAESDSSCDGTDDDCDGAVDEDFAGVPTACGAGACGQAGITTCIEGQVVDTCVPGAPAPDDSVCDGIDADCDGAVDEDFLALETTCGVGSCARGGSTICISGAILDDCTPGQPADTDTTCDGLDDDCDGAADEEYVAEVTQCGAGACAAAGSARCVAGAEVDDCSPGVPAPSDSGCDGIDDDCDGTPDDEHPVQPTTCGIGACAALGELVCAGGVSTDTCEPGTPALLDLACDGVDEDCDGVADEDHLPEVITCGEGVCTTPGTTACIDGAVTELCTPRTPGTQCGLLPELRAGAPKPWEDDLMWSAGGVMAMSPSGNLQQRIPIVAWSPPGVGPPIAVVLYYNSADAALQRGFGLGLRAAATLEVGLDGRVTLVEADGTPRSFSPDGAGGFTAEPFDNDLLAAEGATFVLRSRGGFSRVFEGASGPGLVERFRRDRTGDTVSFEHDTDDRLVRISDSAGRAVTFQYDGGLCTQITEPEGGVVRLEYDGGRLVLVEAPAVAGETPRIHLGYHGASGVMASRSTPGQVSTTLFGYDAGGRLTSFSLQPDGIASRIDYTDGQVAITDASHRTFRYSFYRGQLIASTSPNGQSTMYARDERARATMRVDAYGRRTVYGYNDGSDLILHRDEAGRLVTASYDQRHNLLSQTNAYGETYSYVYNTLDLVTHATNPLGETTETQYDGLGNRVRVIDAAGVVRIQASHDALGRPVSTTDAEGRTVLRQYDAFGNLAAITLPGLPTVQRVSSPLGRVLSSTDLRGELQSFGYDALGRLTRAPAGRGESNLTLDAEGRVTSVSRSSGSSAVSHSVSWSGYQPVAVEGPATGLQISAPTFVAPPLPPPASCAPLCALRCGVAIADTCGGLIDCACDPGLTCSSAGYCVEP